MPYKQKHRTLSTPKPISKRDQRHYWPYLPLVIVMFGLVSILFITHMRASQVLGSSEGIGNSSLLAATNTARQAGHEPQLAENTLLMRAAQAKADDMVRRDYWSHTTPDGKQPWSFIDKTGYKYQVVGENLAYGFSNSDEVIRGWLNSPSHRENLLSGDYHDVGFGIATSKDFNHSGPETVVVALYGKPGQVASSMQQGVLSKSNVKEFGVTRLQTLAGTNGPLVVFMLGLLTGAAVLLLLVKHLAAVKRIFVDSERFVIHHPLFDVTLMAVLIVGAFLAQTVGFVR